MSLLPISSGTKSGPSISTVCYSRGVVVAAASSVTAGDPISQIDEAVKTLGQMEGLIKYHLELEGYRAKVKEVQDDLARLEESGQAEEKIKNLAVQADRISQIAEALLKTIPANDQKSLEVVKKKGRISLEVSGLLSIYLSKYIDGLEQLSHQINDPRLKGLLGQTEKLSAEKIDQTLLLRIVFAKEALSSFKIELLKKVGDKKAELQTAKNKAEERLKYVVGLARDELKNKKIEGQERSVAEIMISDYEKQLLIKIDLAVDLKGIPRIEPQDLFAKLRHIIYKEKEVQKPGVTPLQIEKKPELMAVEKKSTLPYWYGSLFGVGAAALGLGIGFGVAAQNEKERIEGYDIRMDALTQAGDSSFTTYRDTSTAMYVVGSLTLAAGLGIMIYDLAKGKPVLQEKVQPTVGGMEIKF